LAAASRRVARVGCCAPVGGALTAIVRRRFAVLASGSPGSDFAFGQDVLVLEGLADSGSQVTLVRGEVTGTRSIVSTVAHAGTLPVPFTPPTPCRS
jgi:hypothetical protein